jgi:hypothetical protein
MKVLGRKGMESKEEIEDAAPLYKKIIFIIKIILIFKKLLYLDTWYLTFLSLI